MGDDEDIIDAGQERIKTIVMVVIDTVFFLGVVTVAALAERGKEVLLESILGVTHRSLLLQILLFIVEIALDSLLLMAIGVWIRKDFRRLMQVGR